MIGLGQLDNHPSGYNPGGRFFQMLYAYFDGSYRPHVCAYGFIVKNEEMEVIDQGSGRVCRGKQASPNVGEYEALYQAMLWVAMHAPKERVEFNGDSTLVISQMKGESAAHKGKYLPYYQKTIALAEPFIERKLWTFRWIQRGLNSEADELAQYHRY